MKANPCNVVRDLMPLVLDGVASDESRELVEAHVSSCEACRNQYEAMKATLPEEARSAYEEEQRVFVDAMKELKKSRCKRRVLSIVLAMCICAVAAFGGMYAFDRLFRYTVPADNHLYHLSLSVLSDGRIVVTADTSEWQFDASTNIDEQTMDGAHLLYCSLLIAPIHKSYQASSRPHKWCMAVISRNPEEGFDAIYQGKPDNALLLWQRGEELPAASAEMETYFALEDAWTAWETSYHETDNGADLANHLSENYAWQARVYQAKMAVPEWQY